ncbi:hypothetical protein [Acetobacter papayae]|uniref:hypothetical protein n=1 Tax=Acetobacter papayae TaxID=1076592 RepID=UPI00046F5BC2|nr:hypothetical protein [Acetobacter papayae]
MNKPADPAPTPQPAIQPRSGRAVMLGAAFCLMAAGWAGFHAMAPAKQTDATQDNATQDVQGQSAMPLRMIAPEQAAQALAASGYSAKEQADILAAVKRRDLRLLAMPIYDAAGTGGTVSVLCGPWQRTVPLSATPTTVILPIAMAGSVDIVGLSSQGVTGINSGIITAFGPQVLPPLSNGQHLHVSVIAQ